MPRISFKRPSATWPRIQRLIRSRAGVATMLFSFSVRALLPGDNEQASVYFCTPHRVIVVVAPSCITMNRRSRTTQLQHPTYCTYFLRCSSGCQIFHKSVCVLCVQLVSIRSALSIRALLTVAGATPYRRRRSFVVHGVGQQTPPATSRWNA